VRIRTNNNVVDEEVSDPDASATETLKDGTKNCRSVLSHEHTKEVIAKDNSGIKDTHTKDLTIVEEHVKSLKSLLTTDLLRDVRSEAEEDGARDSTPHTLKTDDQNGVKLDFLQKELLNDDLRSLDDLSDNDKSATKSSLSSGDRSIFIAGGCRRIFRAAVSGKSRAVKSSQSNNDKSESNNANTSPVRSMKLTLKEELGEQSREDNHRTTKHLPDRSSDPKETNVHHSGGAHIAKSGGAHNDILLPMGHLSLLLIAPRAIRINKRFSLRNVLRLLFFFSLLDATHNFIHSKTTEHTNEHSLSLEPGLLKLLHLTIFVGDTSHGKDDLLNNHSAGTEGQHTCDNNTCHITHLRGL